MSNNNDQIKNIMALMARNPDDTATVSNVVFSSTNYEMVERPLSSSHPDVKSASEGDEGFGHVFNRKVNETHVQKLMRSLMADFQKGGDAYAKHLPILLTAPDGVGERAKILDGQHRFEALYRINQARVLAGQEPIPYYYTIHFAQPTVTDIAGINSTALSWRLASYVEAYAKNGNDAYQRLIEIHEEYGVPYTAFAPDRAEAFGVETLFSGDLKDGSFKFHRYEALIKFLNDTKDLVDQVNDAFKDGRTLYPNRDVKKWKLTMTYRFLWSLHRAYAIKGFDKNRFRMKLLDLAARGHSYILGLTNTTGSLALSYLLIYNERARDSKFAFRAKDLIWKKNEDSAGVQDTSFASLEIATKDVPR